MASIYDLSWNRSSFLSKLVLVLKSEWRVLRNRNDVGSLSSLSSIYYSVAGTSFSKIPRLRFFSKLSFWNFWSRLSQSISWWGTWAPLGLFCRWQMLPVSNKMFRTVGGYSHLSVSLCDVRQSILRERGKLNEAFSCIIFAISKKPKGYSLALLLISKADILKRRGEWERLLEIRRLVFQAFEIAKTIEKDNPRQAIRIYYGCADLWKRVGVDGEVFLERARKLTEQVGAKDQLVKT